MAIIYTYPPVTNPDGTELIVVSETKNKNSTRLITLAGICEFCDETSCDHSFRYIRTSSVTPAEAIGCNDELTLTSSDASVTITNTGNTVDLKAASGSCPTSYVIKPVECDKETGDCIIVDKSGLWTYSNDCFFADFAPGYIKDFTVNGVGFNPDGPAGGGDYTCFYVEEAVFGATASTCEICCDGPEDPVITITPCGAAAPGPISTLQSNVSGPVGWESAIDNPCEFAYSAGSFEGWPCLTITLGGIDLGALVTLDEIKTQSEPCSCECCLNPCSFILNPCPGDIPSSFDPIVGSVVTPEGWSIVDPCDYNDGDTVVIEFEGDTWCFTLTKVCDEGEIAVSMSAVTGCEDEECETPPPPTNLRWRNCGSEDWLYQTALDPIPAPFNTPGNHYIGDLEGGDINSNCVDVECCIEVEETILVEPETPWSVWLSALSCDAAYSGSSDSCDCCLYHDVATYSRCVEECFIEGYPDVNIDVCAWGNSIGETWKPSTAPDFIKIDIGGGTLCCYTKSLEPPCTEETFTSTGLGFGDLTYDLAWSTCEDCEGPADTYVKYDNCDDPTGDKWASSSGTPGSETWVVGQVIKQSGTCYEVLENPSVLAGPQVELPGYIAYDTPDVNCDCCIAGPNRRYTRCSSEETIVVDPSAWANMNELGIDPQIKIEPTASPGIFICYEFTECTSDAVTPGISDIEISTGCGDPACQPFVELQSCDGVYTETVALANLDPSGSGLIASDVIEVTGGSLAALAKCWTVININAPGPETQVGIQNWTGPVAAVAPLTSCECCDQVLRIYTICDGEPGDSCDPSMSSSILVDVSLVPGWDAVTYQNIRGEETALGLECCYVLNEEIPSCLPPTGTIVSTTTGCADPICVTAEAKRMNIEGVEGFKDANENYEGAEPGLPPPFAGGPEGAGWVIVRMGEETPEGLNWPLICGQPEFGLPISEPIGDTPWTIVNEEGASYLPSFGFDSIGDIVPGALYQINITQDRTLNPAAIEGLEGQITFYE